MTATGPAQADGRRLRIVGIALMVVGALLGVGGVIAAFGPLLGASTVRVAGPTAITAEAGDELAVYAVDGGGREGSCTAVGPDGSLLPRRDVFGNETLTINTTVYTVRGVLTVGTTGVQTVTCTGSGFAVGPRVGVLRVVGGVLLSGFGGVTAFVIGLVLVVRASSRQRPPGPGAQWPGQQWPTQQWPGSGPGQAPWPGQQPPQQPPWPGQQPGQPGQQPGQQPPWPGQPPQQPPWPGQWPGQQPPPPTG